MNTAHLLLVIHLWQAYYKNYEYLNDVYKWKKLVNLDEKEDL